MSRGLSIKSIKKAFSVDDDDALVTSTLEEFYLDQGAFFKFGVTEFLNVPAFANETPGQLQFELEHEAELVRVFGFSVSTLCDKFKMEVWELDARDVSEVEDAGDIVLFSPLVPNRQKIRDFPGSLYKLSGNAEHDLTAEGYELVYSDAYIMESAGGPQAVDAGANDNTSTAIRLESKNYVFRIVNYDDHAGGRDFGIGIRMGVADMCCE